MPRVLYIGFGMEPVIRGGAVTYQHALAHALQRRGWDVTFFLAVPTYTLRHRIALRSWRRDGIRYVEIVNAPETYSPSVQSCNPLLDALTAQVLEQERPDIVHIHELQFHPASIIDVIARTGIPSVKTMHNYYDLCPQRDLMFRGVARCTDYQEGQRCVACRAGVLDPRHGVLEWTLNALPHFVSLPLRLAYRRLKPRKADNPGKAHATGGEAGTASGCALYAAGEYQSRRRRFVDQLNRLSVVHCSAHAPAAIFARHGVAAERIRVLPLAVEAQAQILAKPLHGGTLPVVFGYIGGCYAHKGFHVLLDAFSRLNRDKARLVVWGHDPHSHPPAPPGVTFRGIYRPTELNRVLGEMDVCVVPSIWDEVFGIIGIECRTARVPVIGSRIGGIPDWLQDEVTGYLAEPDNAGDLAAKMARFVEQPARIAAMQKQITPWLTFDEHVTAMADLYQQLLAVRRAAAV
jgi:glycosyltransferase involved in cell wall biosynthesis